MSAGAPPDARATRYAVVGAPGVLVLRYRGTYDLAAILAVLDEAERDGAAHRGLSDVR